MSGQNNHWTSGNALSWALGVTLGLLVGLILLIAIPRTMGGGAEATAAAPAEAAAATPAPAEPAKTEAATSEPAKTEAATSEPAKTEAATSEPAKTEAATSEPAKTETATTEPATPAGEPDIEAGKVKYAGTCAGCHGAEAQGAVGPALKVSNAWTDAEFHAALREGKAPEKTLSAMMPKFAPDVVSDADIANIHAYLKTLN